MWLTSGHWPHARQGAPWATQRPGFGGQQGTWQVICFIRARTFLLISLLIAVLISVSRISPGLRPGLIGTQSKTQEQTAFASVPAASGQTPSEARAGDEEDPAADALCDFSCDDGDGDTDEAK